MWICKSFRWTAIALFLFMFSYAFSQKIQIEIKGDGVVRIFEKSFQGTGVYVSEVKGDPELHFRIKPGKQFYLDSLLIYRNRIARDSMLRVSRDSIYAERDDTLHYYRYGLPESVDTFLFVFREVEPWSGRAEDPYGSRDGTYVQVYKAEELFSENSEMTIYTISLQNDLDLACINNTTKRLPRDLSKFDGNDKILYNIGYFDVWGGKTIVEMANFHMLGTKIHEWAGLNYAFYDAVTINYDNAGPSMISYPIPSTLFPFQFKNCIHFSDMLTSRTAVFSVFQTSKNLILWGSGGNECVYVYNNSQIRDIEISNIFNFGQNKKLVTGATGASLKSVSYFNDKNLVPDIELPTEAWAKGYNLESRQLIDSAFMRNLMGESAEEDFIFEDGFYPRLRHMDERPGRLAASPILLYPGENADNVSQPFYVDTNYGVRWISLSPDVVEIVGDSGYVRIPVDKDSVVRIEAWKGEFHKHVYLTLKERTLVTIDIGYDTICQGDSVKMVNSYARNEGWNYDPVWGDGTEDSKDTVYRLHLYLNPSYHTTFVDSCYAEELPYRVEGVPMENFGNKFDRYVTVEGCDSVREYSLSRRWHHYSVSVRVRGAGMANVTDTTLREDGRLWLDFTASACNKLDSLKIDGRNVPPQSRYLLQNLHGDCEVEAVFGSAPPAESVLRYEVCGDSLPIVYEGDVYGEGEHEIWMTGAAGCDSVLRLQVQIRENTARIAVVDTIAPPCGASEIAFSYRTETGSPKHLRLAFDPAALSAGFRDTTLAVASTGQQTVHIALPPTARPDRYGLRLRQADGTGCYATVDDLVFEIPYPSDIIVQKWSDVLAVLVAEYNGGYEFSGYQWYRNGEPMDGETRPYIYVKPYLRSTDTYAVLLERASDGLKLQSCGVKRKSYPKDFSLELRPNPTTAGETVEVSVNGKPDAEGTIEVFDGLGKPVYQKAFNRTHTLRVNWQPGSYVVRVHDGKGKWTATGKLLVQ